MRVALVHDPASPAAAVAVSASVGSQWDTLPGLAHFLEHMLFMGSVSFPEENAYGAFLAAHGGATNAFTSQDETQYYFSVDAPQLRPALRLFAGFFTGPLLRPDALGREVRAVDAEHAKNLQADGWRGWQLLKHLAAPGSPLAGFSTGSAATLAVPGARDALVAFWGRHYVAPRLSAALVGPQQVGELAALAQAAFGGVPRAPRAPLELAEEFGASSAAVEAAAGAVDAAAAAAEGPGSAPEGAFPPRGGVRGAVALFAPTGLSHEFSLLWALPGAGGRGGRLSLARFLARVINDEGAGGLRAHLRSAGVAEGVDAGVQLSTARLQLFGVTFSLAPSAVEAVRGAGRGPGGARAALSALGGAVGTALAALARLLDALEVEVLRSAGCGWGAGGGGGGGWALSPEEAAEFLGEAGAGAAGLGGALRPPRFPRADPTDVTQEMLSARAERQGPLDPDAPAGGARPAAELLSWAPCAPTAFAPFFDDESALGGTPPPAADAAARLWWDTTKAAALEWHFPSSREPADALAQALASALRRANGSASEDLLAPPSRSVWAPHLLLRLLRRLAPTSAVGLLVTPLAAEIEELFAREARGGGGAGAGLCAAGGGRPLFAWGTGGGDAPPEEPPRGAGNFSLCLSEPVYGTRYALLPLRGALEEAQHGPWGDGSGAGGGDAPARPQPPLSLPPPNGFFPASTALVAHGGPAGALLRSEAARPAVLLLPAEAPFRWSDAWASARVDVASRVASAEGGHGPLFKLLNLSAAAARADASLPPAAALWWAPNGWEGGAGGGGARGGPPPHPRLHIGVEVLPAPGVAAGSARAAVLTALFLSAANEGAVEALAPARAAGAEARLRFNAPTGALLLEAAAFAGAAPALARTALPLLLDAHLPAWATDVSAGADAARGGVAAAATGAAPPPRISAALAAAQLGALARELADAGASATPATTAVSEWLLYTGAKAWRARELLVAAAALAGAPPPRRGAPLQELAAAASLSGDSPAAEALAAAACAQGLALFGAARGLQVVVAGNVDYGGAGALLGGGGGGEGGGGLLRVIARVLYASRLLHADATGGGALLVAGESASEGGVAAEAAAGRAAEAGAPPGAALAGVAAAAAAAALPVAPLPQRRLLLQRAAANGAEENSAVAAVRPLPAGGGEGADGARAAAAAATLLGALLREPAFDELRTRQALGYLVHASVHWVWGAAAAALADAGACALPPAARPPHCLPVRAIRPGGGEADTVAVAATSDARAHLVVVVQSTAVGAAGADERVCDFLARGALAFVEGLTEAAVSDAAGALAAAGEEPPRDGAAAFAEVWAEVSGHTWRFNRAEEEARALRAVTRADVLRAARAAARGGAGLSVEVVGKREVDAAAAAAGEHPEVYEPPRPTGAAAAELAQPRSKDE